MRGLTKDLVLCFPYLLHSPNYAFYLLLTLNEGTKQSYLKNDLPNISYFSLNVFLYIRQIFVHTLCCYCTQESFSCSNYGQWTSSLAFLMGSSINLAPLLRGREPQFHSHFLWYHILVYLY